MTVTTPAAKNIIKPRQAVLAMPEYHPPLAGRELLRLDFNENTFAPSPRVIERMQQITAAGLTKYPEREGVERVVELELTADEKAGLHKSADAVKGLIDACKKLEPKLS